MEWSFRARMLPWAVLTSFLTGFWMTSPGIGVINFSAWWLVVYSVQEICEAIRKTERCELMDDARVIIKESPASKSASDYDEAVYLARLLHDNHFPEAVDWKPLPDVSGVLSQINNMVSGLVRPTEVRTSADIRTQALEEAAKVAIVHKSMNRLDAKCMGNCGEVIAREIRALIPSTPVSQPESKVSLSVLTGYEAAMREIAECDKCDLCEDHLPERDQKLGKDA